MMTMGLSVALREKAVRSGLCVLALTSLAVLAGIVFYLFREGLPILSELPLISFVFGTDWYPAGDEPQFQIGALIAGSLAVTVLASLVAVPLGVMTAAYLSEIASNTTRRFVKPFIELLAALPSVVIGFIGMVLVAPWLQNALGIATGLNLLNASLMLAFMAVPTICSVSEDALHAVPRSVKDASLALGATPWETLKNITLPCALSGVGTAVILGMSRALGETMVVLMVAGGAAIVPESVFDPIRPMPASIAAEMAEAPFGSPHYHALFATGVVLFVLTFIFNAFAFRLAQKYKTNAV
ncbi:MAG: phosphate ABC transporter permease subunit PstC [Duodenibacillus sp.]